LGENCMSSSIVVFVLVLVLVVELEEVEQVAERAQAVARRSRCTSRLEVAAGRRAVVEGVVARRQGRQPPVALDELQRRHVLGRPARGDGLALCGGGSGPAR